MQRMPFTYTRKTQQGVALFVVIVFVMLSMLLALWASRTSLFNEMVVGNDADYQRTFEAAQALMQDAELDIRGENSDGSVCSGSGDVCRTTTNAKIPLETKDVGPLLSMLTDQTPTAARTPEMIATMCDHGLCAKRADKQDFWNDSVTLDNMTKANVGARYGQYTGATAGTGSKPTNPILSETAPNKGGWYWIEVLPYSDSTKTSALITGGSSNLLPLNLTPSVVYRITALAYGRRNSIVVLQQTYAQQKLKD
ncbi:MULTISPECIES: pilus assembly PilX family protein [Comamonas]|jgi:type IV pilus assembly protein PilX|uniref:pilus assembly PilX family protein n=1 Tax=Comamonas TaxID=283 RepID=UPI0012C97B2E|nr:MULTISPECIES: pilus assembly protein [Comamonas]MDR3065873.1 pilus assembly protein [Comamonas sp.]MEB5965492.1 pilus assembly protein [Comamonas testosteroni]MPS94733.1 pilus assembly protein [Comamonas sp.]